MVPESDYSENPTLNCTILMHPYLDVVCSEASVQHLPDVNMCP
jgi:hypothetical protein